MNRRHFFATLLASAAAALTPRTTRLRYGGYVFDAARFIRVRGAPRQYAMRLRLEAVGQAWDGTWKPINHLSYRHG